MSQKISSNRIPFQKLHGAGNDFVLVSSEHLALEDASTFAVESCDRHYGIGADGLIFVDGSDRADLRMVFFNPDGTRDVCGNGMRCIALSAYRKKPFAVLTVEIDNGIVSIESIDGGQIFKVEMHIQEKPAPLTVQTTHGPVSGFTINTGTPHFVVYVPLLDAVPFASLGAELEHHAAFPSAVTVDFVEIVDGATARIRIWERSVGETLACGTAACAVSVVAVENGTLHSPCTVMSRGGVLKVSYEKNDLYLTGPAVLVYEGVYEMRAAG